MTSTPHAFLMVAMGGAIGATGRYAVSILLGGLTRFPWPTLLVNIVGCCAAGFLTVWLLQRGALLPFEGWRLMLLTGVFGGFTTFSAFSVETLRLAEGGNPELAAANVVANVVGTLLAVTLGAYLARHIGL